MILTVSSSPAEDAAAAASAASAFDSPYDESVEVTTDEAGGGNKSNSKVVHHGLPPNGKVLPSPVRQKKKLFENVFKKQHAVPDVGKKKTEIGELIKSRHQWIEEETLRKRKKKGGMIGSKYKGVGSYRIAAFHNVETRDTEDEGSAFLAHQQKLQQVQVLATPRMGTETEDATDGDQKEEDQCDNCSSIFAGVSYPPEEEVREASADDEKRDPAPLEVQTVTPTAAEEEEEEEALDKTKIETCSPRVHDNQVEVVTATLSNKSATSPVHEMKTFFEQKIAPIEPIVSGGSQSHKETISSPAKKDAPLPRSPPTSPAVSQQLQVSQTQSTSATNTSSLHKIDTSLIPVDSIPISEISFDKANDASSPKANGGEKKENPNDVSDVVTDTVGVGGEDTRLMISEHKETISSPAKKDAPFPRSPPTSPAVSQQLQVSQTQSTSATNKSNLHKIDPSLIPVDSIPISEISFDKANDASSPKANGGEKKENPNDVSDVVTDTVGVGGEAARLMISKISFDKANDASSPKANGGEKKESPNDVSDVVTDTVGGGGADARLMIPKQLRKLRSKIMNKNKNQQRKATATPTEVVAVLSNASSQKQQQLQAKLSVEEQQHKEEPPTETTVADAEETKALSAPSTSNDHDEWKMVRVDSNQPRDGNIAAPCDARCSLDTCTIL